MNKLLLQSCLVFVSVISVIPHQLDTNPLNTESLQARILGVDYDFVYCQASDHVVDQYVPFRGYEKVRVKGGGRLGDFEVNYTGFTQEARDAFQFAVDIWDMLLDSEAKIIIDANFADLNSGVLGSAAPTAMYADFSNKVDKRIEFAAPLADKIAGYSLNGTDTDLRCNFNMSTNWFYDFNNVDDIADNQIDFVTVVLHELGHGLGFISRNTFASSNGPGFIRSEEPLITDIFSLLLERGDGTNLLLNYDEASSDLGSALTSGDLFLNTHTVTRDPLPEIFAPDPWNGGSSLSHLDEAVFNSTDPLMTPSISKKEVIHDPEIALEMMNDMGWRSSFIAHRSGNSELVNQPLPISANIFTDEGLGFDSTTVLLIYSQDSFRMTSDTVVLISTDASSKFDGELPDDNITGRYQYYFALADTINKGYSSPLLAPRRYHDVQIGIDSLPPTIIHSPIEFLFLNEEEPNISAQVTDGFTGLDTVVVEFRVNGGSLQSKGFVAINLNHYEQVLNLDLSTLSDGDIIEYRLKATDRAMSSNVGTEPMNGFFSITVKDVPAETEHYENDFEGSSIDFSIDGFSVRAESGFDGSGLHSEHPYQNAGTGNELNFTAQLRVPIKVVEDGMIKFEEVVLVEPAEANNNFGDAQFWDYVIVEASEDNGVTWIALTDGYDSRDQAAWNSRYTTGLTGQNSSSTGDKELLRQRSIPLYQPSLGIEIGDIVILRWRLFSDPFATGWGWMIDDLVIQGNQGTTPIVEYDESNDFISIFPNPLSEDYLEYTVTGDIAIRKMLISDSSGRLVLEINDQANFNDKKRIYLSSLPSGVYFALFQTDKTSITKRFIKF